MANQIPVTTPGQPPAGQKVLHIKSTKRPPKLTNLVSNESSGNYQADFTQDETFGAAKLTSHRLEQQLPKTAWGQSPDCQAGYDIKNRRRLPKNINLVSKESPRNYKTAVTQDGPFGAAKFTNQPLKQRRSTTTGEIRSPDCRTLFNNKNRRRPLKHINWVSTESSEGSLSENTQDKKEGAASLNSPSNPRGSTECKTIEDLHRLYDQIWPFDRIRQDEYKPPKDTGEPPPDVEKDFRIFQPAKRTQEPDPYRPPELLSRAEDHKVDTERAKSPPNSLQSSSPFQPDQLKLCIAHLQNSLSTLDMSNCKNNDPFTFYSFLEGLNLSTDEFSVQEASLYPEPASPPASELCTPPPPPPGPESRL